jgi:hypothetical protein
MRNALRLFIFAAVVAAITLTIAPPVRTSAETVVTAGAQAPAPSADVTGTYAGSITADTPGDMPDSGMIIVRRDGEHLVVTAGPDTTTQFASEKVMRTATGLTFEIAVAGEDATRVLQFDLQINGREMTGTIALLRDGTRSNGRIAFTKQ